MLRDVVGFSKLIHKYEKIYSRSGGVHETPNVLGPEAPRPQAHLSSEVSGCAAARKGACSEMREVRRKFTRATYLVDINSQSLLSRSGRCACMFTHRKGERQVAQPQPDNKLYAGVLLREYQTDNTPCRIVPGRNPQERQLRTGVTLLDWDQLFGHGNIGIHRISAIWEFIGIRKHVLDGHRGVSLFRKCNRAHHAASREAGLLHAATILHYPHPTGIYFSAPEGVWTFPRESEKVSTDSTSTFFWCFLVQQEQKYALFTCTPGYSFALCFLMLYEVLRNICFLMLHFVRSMFPYAILRGICFLTLYCTQQLSPRLDFLQSVSIHPMSSRVVS